ncbi:MAG: hypothetical protein DRP51_05680, partial [Candidatus Zixiibacteriota bacterium]
PSTFIEDVITRDTVSLINEYFYRLLISSDEKFCIVYKPNIYIMSLPDLNFIDSVDNGSLLAIGLDDENKILYAFKRDTSLIYSIDFSATPSDTTIIDVLYWHSNPNRKVSAFLSPDNKTLLINSQEDYDTYDLLQYNIDSMSYDALIPGQKMGSLVWTNDCRICYGINDGNVVKYDTQTKIYSTLIDKENIFTPDYHWDIGEGFYAMDLQITPDNMFLYIQQAPNCGGPCLGIGGHTLVYDISKREIVYRHDYSEYLNIGTGLMRINPKDWNQ